MTLSIDYILNNRYRIDEILSQTEVGTVYRAWDMSLRLAVVIKENFDSSPEARRRSKAEANILTRLSHPNLPRFTDYFFISKQAHYLVMHHIAGETLQAKLTHHGPLAEAELLLWFTQICNALAYLHYQNTPLVHGNISPKNIIIRANGRAILVGGGISKVYALEMRNMPGTGLLKPGYSAIELYNYRLPDHFSDIYALGATLYHLLTGELPPNALDRSDDEAALQFPLLDHPVSSTTQRAIHKAMEPARERRYQNVNRFRAVLEEAMVDASTYRDVLHVFPSSVGTYITGMMVLLIFACTILAVGSLVRDTTVKLVDLPLLEPPTATATVTPTSIPTPVGTPTMPVMQTFKSVALGFSLDYPLRWRKREDALHIRFSPTLRGLETDKLVDMSIWVGVSSNEQASPSDIMTTLLSSFPRQAELLTERQSGIGGHDWRSAQLKFETPNISGMAVVAATRRDEVGYFIVVAAPTDKWETARPIFQQIVTSFQFTKEAEVRFRSEAELPPTPTPTPTPVVYIVQPGDSYGRIAGLYGVRMETLAEENDLRLSDYLRVGQELIIPIGYDE